jgi:bifunctional non-homologous end joining protein LigD
VKGVRIYTRRGVDWTKRFPRIVSSVRKLRAESVLLDGEGVICDNNGPAIFDKLHLKLTLTA